MESQFSILLFIVLCIIVYFVYKRCKNKESFKNSGGDIHMYLLILFLVILFIPYVFYLIDDFINEN